MDLNYLEQKQLGFYAERLNISQSHLSGLCKQYVGKTAQQFLHDRIILEGRRLLKYSSLSVKEIAFRLGYDDPSYFSRIFKAKTGESPQSYRIGCG